MAAKGELSPGRAVRLLLLYGVPDLQGREGDAWRVHTVQGSHHGIVLFSQDDITKLAAKIVSCLLKFGGKIPKIFLNDLRKMELSRDCIRRYSTAYSLPYLGRQAEVGGISANLKIICVDRYM